MHLFALLNPGNHYHLGFFKGDDDSLSIAQHQMCLETVSPFLASESVLDVGCGLGGTARVLSDLGYSVMAIDRCVEAVDYAREHIGESASRCFRNETLESYVTSTASGETGFDGIIMIEVLQHLPRLDEAWNHCRDLLNERGVLTVSDITAHGDFSWERVPFHRFENIRGSAEKNGLCLTGHSNVSDRVVPTFDRILTELDDNRDRFLGVLGRMRPHLSREICELEAQCQHLGKAFQNGDLTYEIMAFECSDQAGV